MSSNRWDRRFVALAEHVAGWSKDASTKVGAVIVNDERVVVGMGYNGFPRGIEDTEERINDRDTKLSLTVHAEMNAILNANGPIRNCTLYLWPFMSCDRCAAHVIQTGIVRVVAPLIDDERTRRWADSFSKSSQMFSEASISAEALVHDPIHDDYRINSYGYELRTVLKSIREAERHIPIAETYANV